MTEKEYARLVGEMAPKSPIVKDCVFAFLVGGLICTLGQVFMDAYTALGLEKDRCGYGSLHDAGVFVGAVHRLEPV